MLAFTSLAILGGTQVFFLRDFLQGGDWYRMNTLFKFFMQVWLLLGLAAGIAVPRLWQAVFPRAKRDAEEEEASERSGWKRAGAVAWASALALLVVASLSYTAFGTPARISERMNGWRPAFGTLNGMDYMRQGSYTWPDGSNVIELKYDSKPSAGCWTTCAEIR